MLSALIRGVLNGVARSQVVSVTAHRVRLPATWSMLRDGESLIRNWGAGGRVMMWLCLCLSYFLKTPYDGTSASTSGKAHPVHCLTRQDVAFSAGVSQWDNVQWQRAEKSEIDFRGHKGNSERVGNVRARDEVKGLQSGGTARGGAVDGDVDVVSSNPSR